MLKFRKLKRLLFAIILTFAILLLVAVMLLPWAAKTGRLTGFIEEVLTDALGARTKVETVSLAPFSELTLKGVTVFASNSYGKSGSTGGNSSSGVIFHCGRILIHYNIFELLKAKFATGNGGLIKLNSISISEPVVILRKRTDGTWNYTPPAGKSRLLVDTLRVENGTLKVIIENTTYEIGGASIVLCNFGPGRRSKIYAHAFVGKQGQEIYSIGTLSIGTNEPEGDIRLCVSRIPLRLLIRPLQGNVESNKPASAATSNILGEIDGSLSLRIKGSKFTIKESRTYIIGLCLSSVDGQFAVRNVTCQADMNGTEVTFENVLACHIVGSGKVVSGSIEIKDLIYPLKQIADDEPVSFEFDAQIHRSSEGWELLVSSDKPWRLNVPHIAQIFASGRAKGTDNYQEVAISLKAKPSCEAQQVPVNSSTVTDRETIADANKNAIKIRGRFDMKNSRVLESTITASEIDVSKLWCKIQPLFLPRAKGWQVSGKLSFDATLGENLTSIRLKPVDLRDFSFISPDGESGCGGLNSHLSAYIQLSTKDAAPGKITIKAEGDMGGFDFISGSFGVSLPNENEKAKFLANGSYDLHEKRLETRCKLEWPDFGTAEIYGEVTEPFTTPDANLNIKLDNISNDTVFTQLVKDNYSMLYSFLDNVSISGRSRLECNFTGSPRKFNLKGKINIAGTSVRIGNLDAEGVEVDMPFSLEMPCSKSTKAVEIGVRSRNNQTNNYGKIVIHKIAEGPIILSDLQFDAGILSNDFVTRQDLSFPLFGGSVTVKNLAIRDLLSAHPKLHMAIYVSDLDISKFTEAYNLPAIKGKLESRFEEISSEGENLLMKGNAVARVFNGTVKVGDVKIENLLESYRTFCLSVELEDIDLESLTSTSGIKEVGKVTGMLRGTIRHLEISAGWPMRFDADLETVKRNGVNQMVTLDFVQSLSLVASGTPPVFDQMVKDWGRVYRYDRFGITCQMRYGDILTISGKFVKDGKEFFMQGPPWGGMNIINEDPGKQVSFKKITARLKNILSGQMPTISTE